MTLGEKIRKRRIELNMTMDDLGNAIGVQRSHINKYEKGMITDLKRCTIHALATALQVSPLYLLDDDNGDEERLEALHQNPKLRLLFDIQKTLTDSDLNAVLGVVNAIAKERGDDD